MNSHLQVLDILQCMSRPQERRVQGLDPQQPVTPAHRQWRKNRGPTSALLQSKLEAILDYIRLCLRKQTKALKRQQTELFSLLGQDRILWKKLDTPYQSLSFEWQLENTTLLFSIIPCYKSLKCSSTLFCHQGLELSQQTLGNSDFFSSLAHIFCLLHILGYFCILHMYA